MTTSLKILKGDCRKLIKQIPDRSVQCIVTSPPYWGLRSYLPKNHPEKHLEIGQEKTPQEYVRVIVEIFRDAKRVLKDKFCDKATVKAYPAMGRGWMALCARHSLRHKEAFSVDELIRKGETFE